MGPGAPWGPPPARGGPGWGESDIVRFSIYVLGIWRWTGVFRVLHFSIERLSSRASKSAAIGGACDV